MDRGGENMPQAYMVDDDPFAWDAISAEMDALDDMRANGKQAPPVLPSVLTRRAVRKSSIALGDLRLDWSGEVWKGPDWRCRYCDYNACPNRRMDSHMLCKMMKTKPMDLTSEGRRHEEDVYHYLRSGQREMSLT
jgi:hypothetical protein